MNPSDLAAMEFPIARKGYDVDAVRAFLVELAASPARCAATPEHVLAEAQVEAERVRAEAQVEAERTVAAAQAEAERLVRTGEEEALAFRAEQESIATARLEEADARATAVLEDAEALARERVTTIIENARVRLQRLLDAEREVHVRLAAAFSSIEAPVDMPLERDDEALLDLAFAEFFSSDIEHDESRAWILSDQAG